MAGFQTSTYGRIGGVHRGARSGRTRGWRRSNLAGESPPLTPGCGPPTERADRNGDTEQRYEPESQGALRGELAAKAGDLQTNARDEKGAEPENKQVEFLAAV